MSSRLICMAAISAALIGCGESTLDWRNAQVNNGIVYSGSSNEPFSGHLTNIPEKFLRSEKVSSLFGQHFRAMEKLDRQQVMYMANLLCNSKAEDGIISGGIECFVPNSTAKRWEGNFKGGMPEGKFTIYSLDGKNVQAEGEFSKGLPDGVSRFYGLTGNLIAEHYNKSGKGHGQQRQWDANTGAITYSGEMKDGRYVGVVKSWAPNGILIGELPYENGNPNGVAKVWSDKTGQLTSTTTLVDGIRDGQAARWDENGNLLSSGKYVREVWYPNTAEPATNSPQNDKESGAVGAGQDCLESWTQFFRKHEGEDALITSEHIKDWTEMCSEGTLPDNK